MQSQRCRIHAGDMRSQRKQKGKSDFLFAVLPSDFGNVVVVWRSFHNTMVRVFLPRQFRLFKSSDFHRSGVECIPSGFIAEQCRRIEAMLQGHNVRFDLEVCDWSITTRFQRRVLLMENKIPWGRVSTYYRVASKIGKPSAARAVGNALARNPFPLVIPCHRAIRSDGSLGGYAGGIEMKRKLLELEGIEFDSRGRVITNRIW